MPTLTLGLKFKVIQLSFHTAEHIKLNAWYLNANFCDSCYKHQSFWSISLSLLMKHKLFITSSIIVPEFFQLSAKPLAVATSPWLDLGYFLTGIFYFTDFIHDQNICSFLFYFWGLSNTFKCWSLFFIQLLSHLRILHSTCRY